MVAFVVSRRRTGRIEKIFPSSKEARDWISRDPSLFTIERAEVYNYMGYKRRQLVIFVDREGPLTLKEQLKTGKAFIGKYPVINRKYREFAESESSLIRMRGRLDQKRKDDELLSKHDKQKRAGIFVSQEPHPLIGSIGGNESNKGNEEDSDN